MSFDWRNSEFFWEVVKNIHYFFVRFMNENYCINYCIKSITTEIKYGTYIPDSESFRNWISSIISLSIDRVLNPKLKVNLTFHVEFQTIQKSNVHIL